MGYEVIIYGDLTLDLRAVSAWKKTKLDATALVLLLIVDDDLDILELSKKLLESAGHRIRVARDRKEGSGKPGPYLSVLK